MILFDSNAVCHSHRYKLGHMETSQGVPSGIVFGFFQTMMSLYKKTGDADFCFAWDSARSERIRIFPKYKWKRRHKDKSADDIALDEMTYPQFNELRKVILPTIGFVNNFHQVGYEGDDVVASILYNNAFTEKPLLVTGDEDMYQCLDQCTIYLFNKKEYYTKSDLFDEFGITPAQWVLVKKIGGCSTDEVPGIEGVGEVRACKYILKDLPRKSTFYQRIKNGSEIIAFNEKLVKLPMEGTKIFTVENQFPLVSALMDVLEEYELKSLIKRKDDWIEMFADAAFCVDDIPF